LEVSHGGVQQLEINATQRQSIREYLLGRLPPAEQPQFEDRLLTDDEFYEELVIIEDELVDDYLRGDLTAADRASFDSFYLLAPEHQEKLNFARAFSRYLTAQSQAGHEPAAHSAELGEAPADQARELRTRSPKPWFGFLPMRSPALGYAMIGVLVVMVLGVSWLVWRKVSTPRDPGRILAVALTPKGFSRSEGSPDRIVVPADKDTLRLQLLLPDNRYESYAAIVVADETITTARDLRPESGAGQPVVILDVETALVPTGDYRVMLRGVTANGDEESVATYLLLIQNNR
jgi:hypothetical protein